MFGMKEIRGNVCKLLVDNAEYLEIDPSKISESSDKLQSVSAPAINVGIRWLSSGDYLSREESKALVIIVFQLTTKSTSLDMHDKHFDYFEMIEYLLYKNSIKIGNIINLEYELQTDPKTSLNYGVITFVTDYIAKPKEA